MSALPYRGCCLDKSYLIAGISEVNNRPYHALEDSSEMLLVFVLTRKLLRSPRGRLSGNPTELSTSAKNMYQAAIPATKRKAPPAYTDHHETRLAWYTDAQGGH